MHQTQKGCSEIGLIKPMQTCKWKKYAKLKSMLVQTNKIERNKKKTIWHSPLIRYCDSKSCTKFRWFFFRYMTNMQYVKGLLLHSEGEYWFVYRSFFLLSLKCIFPNSHTHIHTFIPHIQLTSAYVLFNHMHMATCQRINLGCN